MNNAPFKEEDWQLCPSEIPARVIRAAKSACENDGTLLIDAERPSTGYCYRCGSTVKAGAKNRYKWKIGPTTCPACGKSVFAVRAESHTTWDTWFVANVGTIQKGTDGESVWIREWHVRRMKTTGFHGPDQLKEVARWAIRGNRYAKWLLEEKHFYWPGQIFYDPLTTWKMQKSHKRDHYDDGFAFAMPDKRQMKSIVRGTSLRYMDLGDYDRAIREQRFYNRNILGFAIAFAADAAFEKMWKAKYTRLCDERINGGPAKSAINWKAKTVKDAIGVPKELWPGSDPESWSGWELHTQRRFLTLYKDGRITLPEYKEAVKEAPDEAVVKRLLKTAPVSLSQILKYRRKTKVRLYDLADYYEQAKELNLDLKDKRVAFPKDFDAAHARTIAETEYKKNKDLQKRFEKAVENLKKLAWETGGILIRPAASQEELIYEGKKLAHCVGGYADRMAKGETAIFFIRSKELPEEPFYTLEYRNGRVIQCRTLKNESYENNPDIYQFVNQWADHIRKAT